MKQNETKKTPSKIALCLCFSEKNGFLQVADLKQVMTTLGDRLTSGITNTCTDCLVECVSFGMCVCHCVEEMDALTEAADGEMISYDAFCKMLAAE